MPPSPSLRRSATMEPRTDSHKRGRSLESGLSFKGREKDEDLTLFNQMQNREAENFLLQPTDEFEDIFSSKVEPFPDFKLGINIPARGENRDLLNAEGEKNDYDWLLTPPDTPLFPSLDDDPTPANLVHTGRARTRPIPISRSSTVERSQRSSRGSPSPQRLSPSPRNGSGAFRGRPSSAPHSSPINLRPSTPSRRPSPPPVKPSTPPPRTSTPPSRRASTSTAPSVITTGLRGTSPVRTGRGNSASPKIRAWQSNIPGFSLEAPPNLRTSLADRPATYVRGSSPASRTSRDSSNVRGSSPASRTSRDSSSKHGRQSMSPTASRSISSSHSQERDRLSSHSKGSVASSGDDDADSLHSVPVNISDRPMSRKGVGSYSNNRHSGFSKKPMKTFAPSSAPKRSFDSAIRQMDRKSPPNMFRPLLSSVPSSTFYAGKVSSAHHVMLSRNSSITTSSNASSDQATSGAHDTEGSDLYQDDVASEYARPVFSDIQDTVFGFDKIEVGNVNNEHALHESLPEGDFGDADANCESASHLYELEESSVLDCDVANDATFDPLAMQEDTIKISNHYDSLICSRCGSRYHPDEVNESEESRICPQCKQTAEQLIGEIASVPLTTDSEGENTAKTIMGEILLEPEVQLSVEAIDTSNGPQVDLHEENVLETKVYDGQHEHNCLDSAPSVLAGEEFMDVVEEHRSAYNSCHTAKDLPQTNKNIDKFDQNYHVPEGAGISVLLLNRSSSVKGPLIHGRTFNSSAVSYDDLSYPRDFASSMRSSVGHGSISTSSSVDLASGRHLEMRVQRQLSGKKSDTSSKPQSTVSSLSGTLVPVYHGFSGSSHEENFEGSIGNMGHIVEGESPVSPSGEAVQENADFDCAFPSVSGLEISEEANDEILLTARDKEAFPSGGCIDSRASFDINEGCVHNELDENQQNSSASVNVEDNAVPDAVAEEPTQCSSPTMSEIKIDSSQPCSPRSQLDMETNEETTHMCSEMYVEASCIESFDSDHADGIVEESTVMVEDYEGRRTRSLTLEEATDTILFCSSIVHDLAYKAASIAIEKEKENMEPLEVFRPTVTIPDKRSSDHKDTRGSTRTTKTNKVRKRRAESEEKPSSTDNEEKPHKPVVRNVGLPKNGDSTKPQKLESKCNCTIM